MVRGRMLVQQAHLRLQRENVEHGVLMAGHWARNDLAKIQVCSIDTIIARGIYPEADLIVIDEAHMAISTGYKSVLSKYQNAYVLAVTATPYVKEPMHHLADVVVSPISISELISQGYLVPPRYFDPIRPDLKGVDTQNGDFVTEQLETRMAPLIGNIVDNWIKYAGGRPTICFAVSIAHSKSIVEQFKSRGINAEHLEANHSFKERENAISRLRSGQTSVISNVGILCTGVDIPFLSCIIMARPTKSYNLYIQQAGRGTRPHPETNKRDFILLDHTGNINRHGFITIEPEVNLDGTKKIDTGRAPKTCKKCYLMYDGPFCPDCGKQESESHSRNFETEDGELKELVVNQGALEYLKELKKQGNNNDWIHFKLRTKYGSEIAQQIFPRKRKRLISPSFLSPKRNT